MRNNPLTPLLSLTLITISVMLASPLSAAAQVTITSPHDSGSVCQSQRIAGTVEGQAKEDASKTVWIVIHPKLVANYWVQIPATFNARGQWTSYANFGRPGLQDQDAPFEFRGFVKPGGDLRPGQVLNQWPSARWSSEVLDVKRGEC